MIYRVSEFAKHLGVKPQTVNTWGSRGKLNIIGGDIDDSHPINELFLKKREARSQGIDGYNEELEKKEVKKEPKIKPEIKKEEPKKEIIRPTRRNETSDTVTEAVTASNIFTKLKSLKLKEEIEAVKIKNRRATGELVEKDFFIQLFQRFMANSATEYYSAGENFITELCSKLQVDRDTMVKLRSQFKEIVNNAIEKARLESVKEISNYNPENE